MRIVGVKVEDATSGFRCWRASLLGTITRDAFKSKHFAFQLETLYRAHQNKAIILETPIPYKLTNSSFKPIMLLEAIKIYLKILYTEAK